MEIIFHVGGPNFHPVRSQAEQLIGDLAGQHACRIIDGSEAFDNLNNCKLLVIMGLHWPGMADDWAGNLTYRPLTSAQQDMFQAYVESGRPLLAHHGAIASYSDWPRFGQLVGFSWVWGTTSHSPVGTYNIEVLPTGHPVVNGIQDYSITDELYYDVEITPGLEPVVHAEAQWENRRLPMIMTAEGGRAVGAGRTAYLANGHDMISFACPMLTKIWLNTIQWLLGGRR